MINLLKKAVADNDWEVINDVINLLDSQTKDIEDIIESAGFHSSILANKSRKPEITNPRHCAWYIMHRVLNYKSYQIARRGRFEPSSVRQICLDMEKLIQNPDLNLSKYKVLAKFINASKP